MLSDYFLTTSPLSMTEEERFNVAGMRASWKAIAQEKTNAERSQIPPNMFKCLSQDLEAEWDSPILFPDKAPKELLAELPPTVVISAEFDMFITGSLPPSNTPLIFPRSSTTFFGIPRDRTLCGETSKSRVIGGLLLHARYRKPKKWGVVCV